MYKENIHSQVEEFVRHNQRGRICLAVAVTSTNPDDNPCLKLLEFEERISKSFHFAADCNCDQSSLVLLISDLDSAIEVFEKNIEPLLTGSNVLVGVQRLYLTPANGTPVKSCRERIKPTIN